MILNDEPVTNLIAVTKMYSVKSRYLEEFLILQGILPDSSVSEQAPQAFSVDSESGG